jgi:uncharacterized membrane protein
MTSTITRTAHDDAPLSAAKHLDPDSIDALMAGRKGDTLIGRTVTIDKPKEVLYDFWRDFSNLPAFMENIRSVSVTDPTHSHWVIAGPAGQTAEWDSEITRDEPGSVIEWRSLQGASVQNSGQVEFADSPDGRGSIVRVTIAYDPPAGAIGKLIAKLFQREPKIQARQDLRRFKQLMETGEVATARPPYAAPRA